MPERLHAGRMAIWTDDRGRAQRVLGSTLDPDWLLTSPRCQILKLQRRVMVGRMEVEGYDVYVKRYNPYAVRAVAGATFGGSFARRAFQAAAKLREAGFEVPAVVAAAESRVAGVVGRSFFVTIAVPDAVTLDERWRQLGGPTARTARARLADGVGRFFARLHAAGVYHADLKDVNLLVRPDDSIVLLDLERVEVGRPVREARRVKNLMQLERTLGRVASRTERLRCLRGYLGRGATRDALRRWARLVREAATAKDRGRTAETDVRPSVGAMVVCQDEGAHITACLDGVRWCDEIVVVDGGSTDETVALAEAAGARVVENPWPGFREQKQVGLDASTSAWVLNVDADERIPHELAARIVRELVRVPEGVDGLAIPRLVPYLGRWWFRGGWYPRHIVRVVRRAATRWGGVNPHERPIVAGRVRRLDVPMVHYSYVDVGDHVRTVLNLTRVAAERFPPGTRIGGGRLFWEPAWRFARSYVLKRGALEGLPGFFVAMTDAVYVLARAARVWERSR